MHRARELVYLFPPLQAIGRFAATMLLLLATLIGQSQSQEAARLDPKQLAMVASQILGEQDESKKEGLIAQHKAFAPELIAQWTKDLESDVESRIEYQRIPSIWRISILAVRDSATRVDVLPRLLDLALPTPDSKMRDWQLVVLGGAIINGLSLENLWPKDELAKCLSEHPNWNARWELALELAKKDAIDPKIPAGTRYDAIRILAMLPAEQAIEKAASFLDVTSLDPAVGEELQMGAVSALSDIDDPRVVARVLAGYPSLSSGNQKLAREAMLRSESRKLAWEIYESDSSGKLYNPLPLTLEHAFTEGIEGPASDEDGSIYAVNYQRQQTIGKINRWGTGSAWAQLPGKGVGNGIVFDSQGDLLVADYVEHKIWRIDRVTGQFFLHSHEPAMNQPNDLAIANDGTLYATDPDWAKGTGRVWRIDRKGIAKVVADAMGTTNGIDISPDGRYLAINESLQRKIWRFEINQDGTLGQKSLFKEFPDHGFDGMRYDEKGNLYVTRYGKGTVVVLGPEGEILHEVDVLGNRPSNICFGGKDGRTVCVTEVEHGRLIRFRAEHPGRKPRFDSHDQRADWFEKIHRWSNTSEVLSDQDGENPLNLRSENWDQVHGEIKKRFDQVLGPMPAVGNEPKQSVISEDRIDGVIRRRIRLEIEPKVHIDAYLLIPEGLGVNDKRPGMIALHPTNNQTIGEIAGVESEGPRATGLEFAKLGYIVICPKCFLWQDVGGFEEAVANHRANHPAARGIAKMVYDAQRALDALVSIPQVDTDRIFAFGHSLGAKEVLYLMAKDMRVTAGLASEGGVSLKSTNWEAPWYLGPEPRLTPDWGHDELLCLIAPRPLLIMGGERGPGAADGSQSLTVLRNSSPAWWLQQRSQKGKKSSKPSDFIGLALWNHGQGHVFGEAQFQRAKDWFDQISAR